MRVTGGLTATGAAQAAPMAAAFLSVPGALVAWAAMPAAETEFMGLAQTRQRFDLSGKTAYRLQAITGVPGVAGSKLRAKYSLDAGATWTTLEAAAGTVGNIIIDAAGLVVGASAPLAPLAAVADVWVAVFGVSGNGVVSPTFASVGITFT